MLDLVRYRTSACGGRRCCNEGARQHACGAPAARMIARVHGCAPSPTPETRNRWGRWHACTASLDSKVYIHSWQVRRLFDDLDTNGDGDLSYEEFLTGLARINVAPKKGENTRMIRISISDPI